MRIKKTQPFLPDCRYLPFLLLLLLSSLSVQGSDRVREKEIERSVLGGLVVGEQVPLETDGSSFLAIYAKPERSQNQGVAVLLHGLGSSPVQSSVIEPLRTGLPEHGWGTLSLQMPILEPGAKSIDYYPLMPEAVNRIKAAIQFLEKNKTEKIVLIGHSMGAVMGLSYLAGESNNKIFSAVLIGLFVSSSGHSNADTLAMLAKVDKPLLDLYGSRDLPTVTKTTAQRRQAASENNFYQQLKVESANHFFRGMDDQLLARIYGWMNRTITKLDKIKEETN